jgi:PAS domain S-box-containing protein
MIAGRADEIYQARLGTDAHRGMEMRTEQGHEGFFLSGLLDASVDGILAFDLECRYTAWNSAMERISGLRKEQVLGKRAFDVFPFLKDTGEDKYFFEALAGRCAVALDRPYAVPEADREGFFEAHYSPLRGASGEVIGGVGVVRDITDRRRAEEAAREAHQRLRFHVENTPLAVIEWDGDFRVSRWSASAERFFGWKAEEVVGKRAADWRFVFPEDVAAVEQVTEMQRGGGERQGVLRNRNYRRDGSVIHCEWYNSVLRDESGDLLSVLSLVLDVTERVRAEEALRGADRRALLEYERLLVRVTELGQVLGTARDLATIFQALREFALRSVPSSGIFISLYDRDSQTRTPVYAWSEGAEVDVSTLPPMPMSDSPHSRAVLTGQVVITDDFQAAIAGQPVAHVGLERDPRLPQSSLAVPMAVMGRVVGGLEVQSTGRAAYGREHATALQMAANLAAAAVENVRLIERESRARAGAEEANRLKDEFLATLSHELRTPLTTILGYAAMLNGGAIDPADSPHAMQVIERSARAEATLINDLLDASRAVAGKFRLSVRPVELSPVVEAAVASLRPAAQAKGLQLHAKLNTDVGTVEADPDRLLQVVWNLLSNAVKFTPQGGRVEVKLERVGSSARLRVSDTGEGISPEFLPYVFERFRQADGSITRRHGGLGLGLTLVRHLVEMHGGTVRAESGGRGQGATFTVTLPLHAEHAGQDKAERLERQAAGGQGAAGGPTGLHGLRVLVVEDDADWRELLGMALTRQGAEVTAVSTAEEALDVVERSLPDVLVSDIGMPDADGYELLRRIRALPPERGGRVPAVALTGYARDADRRRAIAEGYQAHVAKPVEMAELVNAVSSVARGAGRI